MLQLPLAAAGGGGPRRARLSSDLTALPRLRLRPATSTSSSRGSVEKIERWRSVTACAIKKQLASGAVFTRVAQALEALSQDLEVDTVSGNSLVRSHMAMTTTVTGADGGLVGRD